MGWVLICLIVWLCWSLLLFIFMYLAICKKRRFFKTCYWQSIAGKLLGNSWQGITVSCLCMVEPELINPVGLVVYLLVLCTVLSYFLKLPHVWANWWMKQQRRDLYNNNLGWISLQIDTNILQNKTRKEHNFVFLIQSQSATITSVLWKVLLRSICTFN